MKALYVRVSDESYDYVDAESERTGLPKAKVVDAVLGTARRQQWRVHPPVADMGRGNGE